MVLPKGEEADSDLRSILGKKQNAGSKEQPPQLLMVDKDMDT